MEFLFIVTPIVGVCNCSMFCCTLLCVRSSIAIILMGKRELVALLKLSSWCLVMVERLFLTVPQGCLRFVIVVFPDHTHLLFLNAWYLFCLCKQTAKVDRSHYIISLSHHKLIRNFNLFQPYKFSKFSYRLYTCIVNNCYTNTQNNLFFIW